ncbi:MAG TPA: helix-turn-helix domain-containing protein [Gaiellaceae bacterium]|nr:helix-turn-helix domain-containing protein [Gaiellaceae bacterium]
MPKISEERRAERREQILAGARRAFAEHGYEGATVAKLEQATGLSRGAIFNYFPSKEDLFLELAWRDNQRLVQLWLDRGWEAALRAVVEEDPEWLGVYLELTRKIRTDPEFRRRHEERTEEELAPLLLAHVRGEQERGELRDDYPPERVAGFVSLVANGVVLQMAYGERIRDVDALIDFVRTAVAPRAPGRARASGPSRTPS